MEGAGNRVGGVEDEVTRRAAEAVKEGRSGQRSMYEAVKSIVDEEAARRREVLTAYQDSGDESPLDPELFPPSVFEPDGTRKLYNDGSEALTDAEIRAAFEWKDSGF